MQQKFDYDSYVLNDGFHSALLILLVKFKHSEVAIQCNFFVTAPESPVSTD